MSQNSVVISVPADDTKSRAEWQISIIKKIGDVDLWEGIDKDKKWKWRVGGWRRAMKSADTVKEWIRENKGWWMSVRVGLVDRTEMQEGGRSCDWGQFSQQMRLQTEWKTEHINAAYWKLLDAKCLIYYTDSSKCEHCPLFLLVQCLCGHFIHPFFNRCQTAQQKSSYAAASLFTSFLGQTDAAIPPWRGQSTLFQIVLDLKVLILFQAALHSNWRWCPDEASRTMSSTQSRNLTLRPQNCPLNITWIRYSGMPYS